MLASACTTATAVKLALLLSLTRLGFASPAQAVFGPARATHGRFFDVQAHRGGRGNTVENTLPSFAWGLIDGATTLEMDNGITKDGVVIVWHDEEIVDFKCQDTSPAFPDDPDFPYVGKFVANLTLAQVKTLDCGSKRQDDFPMQLTYPGTPISTLQEVFDFAECADPAHQILWNIESKLDARNPNRTVSVQEFVDRQYEVFKASPYHRSITYESFDWRSLVAMKKLDPDTSMVALIEYDTTLPLDSNRPSPWFAGLDLDAFSGSTLGSRLAQAAHAIGVDTISPEATYPQSSSMDPTNPAYEPFTTRDMVDEAHRLGISVKPWSVNRLSVVEELMRLKVDGIITDYPNIIRRWAKAHGHSVAPKYPKQRVLACLEQHMPSR
ncbi:hypothetical protein PLICRDRAFT_101113 [Plicaturopsis crispa FD-325 SS-3]|nr:hypothetical protein PLICRDRAFT_101113 [Plicaturopsis crispa FD-325 SS-3]